MYFSFAKKKLELSRKRKSSGSKGGATMRIKVTDEEISKATEKKNQYVSFDDFMAENPKIKNDLYASRMHLLDGVNWMKLDCGLEKSDYKDCDSLYREDAGSIFTFFRQKISRKTPKKTYIPLKLNTLLLIFCVVQYT